MMTARFDNVGQVVLTNFTNEVVELDLSQKNIIETITLMVGKLIFALGRNNYTGEVMNFQQQV